MTHEVPGRTLSTSRLPQQCRRLSEMAEMAAQGSAAAARAPGQVRPILRHFRARSVPAGCPRRRSQIGRQRISIGSIDRVNGNVTILTDTEAISLGALATKALVTGAGA